MLRISSLQARLTAPTESSRANATSTDSCSQHTRTYAGAANYHTAGAQPIDKTACPTTALSTAPGPGTRPRSYDHPRTAGCTRIFIPPPLLHRHRHRAAAMNFTHNSTGAPLFVRQDGQPPNPPQAWPRAAVTDGDRWRRRSSRGTPSAWGVLAREPGQRWSGRGGEEQPPRYRGS